MRKAAGGEQLVERSILAQESGGALWPHTLSARNPVGRITAQRYEIRHLPRLDPIALANFGRTYPCHLACLHRLKNGGPLGCELKGIPIAGGHNGSSLAPFLLGNRRSQEIVGLVSSGLGIGETTGRNEIGSTSS